MPSRVEVPIKYTGAVNEHSLLTPDLSSPNAMQMLSLEALGATRSFKRFTPEKQNVVVQALSVLGAYTVSTCGTEIRNRRWAEFWAELEIDAEPLVKATSRVTSEAVLKTGYQNLFQMIQEGVDSISRLNSIRAIGEKEGEHQIAGLGMRRSKFMSIYSRRMYVSRHTRRG